jgi:hypothetical protein
MFQCDDNFRKTVCRVDSRSRFAVIGELSTQWCLCTGHTLESSNSDYGWLPPAANFASGFVDGQLFSAIQPTST